MLAGENKKVIIALIRKNNANPAEMCENIPDYFEQGSHKCQTSNT